MQEQDRNEQEAFERYMDPEEWEQRKQRTWVRIYERIPVRVVSGGTLSHQAIVDWPPEDPKSYEPSRTLEKAKEKAWPYVRQLLLKRKSLGPAKPANERGLAKWGQ